MSWTTLPRIFLHNEHAIKVVDDLVWISSNSGADWHSPAILAPTFIPTLITGSGNIFASSGNAFVATDGNGAFAVTTDLETWTPVVVPPLPALNATLLAGYAGGPFVVTDGDTWFCSDDGSTWSAVSLPPA